ncbi:MAG: methyltransferase domain-containing protein [Nitrospiraceae bacterium]|nr:methyltransferase domain-containing protein [Nitrospiraceae bacterium]
MRWDADKYDSVKAPQVGAGRELIRLARVKETDSVLDIGCGTGKLTIELASLASKGSVLGIDPSGEMLKKARKVSGQVHNLRLLKSGAQEMDFEGVFDLAFSNSALQWVKEQLRASQRTYRALKPGGRIAFQMPAKGFCHEFFEYAGLAIKKLGFERFFESFESPWCFVSKQEYAGLLKDAGFLDVKVFYKDYRLAFNSIKEVLDWWSSAGLRPYLAMLPEAEQEFFKNAFAMQFENNRTGGGIEFSFRRLFAFGEKR